MFSGLIDRSGTVRSLTREHGGVRLVLDVPEIEHEGVLPKDSIAVDGVCLTVTARDGDRLAFDVVPETLARSTLGELQPGGTVNVELSLRVGDRVGGHFVYGHVDAASEILAKTAEGQGRRLTVATPTELRALLPAKAFVAIDGVSLTVAAAHVDRFEIALIPETLLRTTLGHKSAGDRVNIEVDPLARYALAALEAAR